MISSPIRKVKVKTLYVKKGFLSAIIYDGKRKGQWHAIDMIIGDCDAAITELKEYFTIKYI